MRPRELNLRIAKDVFGYTVSKQKGVLTENHPKGDRPLRDYVNSIEWAWEVADHMKVTLIPVAGDNWFAFVGSPTADWKSPQDMFRFLADGQFSESGAALDKNPAFAICMAALNVIDKRQDASAPTAGQFDNVTELDRRH